jgi:cytochrome b involved in lipid metabolism
MISSRWRSVLLSLLIILLFALLISFTYLNKKEDINVSTGTVIEISQLEVAKHNTSDNCWIIFGTKVFNVSPYNSKFPDDSIFIEFCGKILPEDFTISDKKTAEVQKMLNNYYLGIVTP